MCLLHRKGNKVHWQFVFSILYTFGLALMAISGLCC